MILLVDVDVGILLLLIAVLLLFMLDGFNRIHGLTKINGAMF